jgi:hypothetical protein
MEEISNKKVSVKTLSKYQYFGGRALFTKNEMII